MAITKAKKNELVTEMRDSLKDAQSIVFVRFNKLPVKETMALRRALRAESVGYQVVKKTLLDRVLGEKSLLGDAPSIPGEVAMAWGTDLLAPAREVFTFVEKYKGQLEIVGGVFDGVYKSKEEMNGIARIPSLKTLQAQFVGLINSPIQSFVSALSQIAEKKG